MSQLHNYPQSNLVVHLVDLYGKNKAMHYACIPISDVQYCNFHSDTISIWNTYQYDTYIIYNKYSIYSYSSA